MRCASGRRRGGKLKRGGIAAAVLALHVHGVFARSAVRGFVPTVGNGGGYLVPPSGAAGCGYDWAACFPLVYGAVSDWLAQLQAAYSPDAPAGGIPAGVDALAPFSAAASAKLARGWEAAADAGRDFDGAADALAAAARRDAAPWAQQAGAAGAAALGAGIDGAADEAAALQDAAQTHADATLALAQRVSDAAAALAAAESRLR